MASSSEQSSASSSQPIFHFTDITRQAGIRFKHNNGAFGLRLMPETMGSGAAFIDYDNDGYQDIFFVNSRDWTDAEIRDYKTGAWLTPEYDYHISRQRSGNGARALTKWVPPRPKHRRTPGALYRNNGDGTFTDVTQGSGLDIEMFGMGAAAGDYDNDGRCDLYVTAWGRNYLFRNQGQGRFREVARQAGVQGSGWGSGAAFFDYDKDGKLDLLVCRYVRWSPRGDVFRTLDGARKSYAWPVSYPGDSSSLYRNRGDGTFADVSQRAGIARRLSVKPETRSQGASSQTSPRKAGEKSGAKSQALAGKSLGVAVCDYNDDGWPDVAIANDTRPNWLFRNNRDGTFTEVGAEAGIAYSSSGKARAGMGIDAGDMDGSGRDSFVIGNFNAEMLALYRNRGGNFTDIAPDSPMGQASITSLTFGCLFTDFDNDGRLDIFAANGHIDPDVRHAMPLVGYPQRPLLFHNAGGGRFQEVGWQSGAVLRRRIVARGLAVADIDLDGDSDVLLTTNGGAPLLLRNDTPRVLKPALEHNALRLVLRGSRSNRDGIGALVKATIGGTTRTTLRRMVRSGSSYLSQSELPLTIGMGAATRMETLSIHWPSGATTILNDVTANQIVTVHESKGVVRRQPLRKTAP